MLLIMVCCHFDKNSVPPIIDDIRILHIQGCVIHMYPFFTEVYFTVGLTSHAAFPDIVQFDRIIVNVGDGYVGDPTSVDYGKFIAPVRGSYMINAVIYNDIGPCAADLRKNAEKIIVVRNGNQGSGSQSLVLDLEAGDELFLWRSSYLPADTLFDKHHTSFSGSLLHAAV